MNKVSHRQPPWRWYWKERDGEIGETDCGVVADDGYSVCRAPRYQKKNQWEADAALIAAAPRLLASGIEAAATIELMLTECDMRGISKRGIDALVQLTEAIQQTEAGQ